MAKENEMSKTTVVVLTIVAVLLFTLMVTGSWIWGSYNTFIVSQQDLETQFSNIKTEYQRRADLFINLVEIASSYASFEKGTLIEVTQARASATQIKLDDVSGTKVQQLQQLETLDTSLARLLVTFEKYPELKAIEQFNQVLQEVQRTENRVQIARSDYNSLVRSYNILVSKFPKNILAGMWGYDKEQFFENEPVSDTAPKLKFNI